MRTRQATKIIATPRFDSFHFGMFTCAICLGSVESGRVSEELKDPVFGDQAETEILIPLAGRASIRTAGGNISRVEVPHER